jgi:hypothetical protein
MKNISTGTGIALLAGAIVAYPIIDRVMPRAEAGATHVAAVVAAATAQNPPAPTIVWYQAVAHSAEYGYWMLRAWSDGKIESRWCRAYNNVLGTCAGETNNPACFGAWVVISAANMGYNAAADINFDSKVDGADLSQVLAMWGDAPRQDIPPSTCPLNLINP